AGEKDGNELVYPKAQAMTIAQASGEPVMAVDSAGTSIDDWKTGSISRVTAAESQSTASTPTPPTTTAQQPPTPHPELTRPPPALTSPPPTPQPAASPTPEQPPATAAPARPSVSPPSATDNERPVGTSGNLPNTASELPLIGLIGLLALGGALAIRAARAV